MEQKFGWILYALSIPTLFTGAIYFLNQQPWYYGSTIQIFALWGSFEYYIDVYQKIA
jgi:hypothetical protein